MGLLSSILGGGVGQLVKDVVGTFQLSPEAKLEFEAKLVENEFQLRKIDAELEAKVLDAQAREIEAASSNIRAEAQSGDKFTSRARPTFLYIVYVILINNYVVIPWAGRTPVEFPEALFWLFGTVMTGYVASRGWEKVSQWRMNGK